MEAAADLGVLQLAQVTVDVEEQVVEGGVVERWRTLSNSRQTIRCRLANSRQTIRCRLANSRQTIRCRLAGSGQTVRCRLAGSGQTARCSPPGLRWPLRCAGGAGKPQIPMYLGGDHHIPDLTADLGKLGRIERGHPGVGVEEGLELGQVVVDIGPGQGWDQMVDDDRMGPALRLGSLAGVVHHEGIDEGQVAQGRVRETGCRQTHRLARQPLQRAVLSDVHDGIRTPALVEPTVETKVVVGRGKIGRVVYGDRILPEAPGRLDRHQHAAQVDPGEDQVHVLPGRASTSVPGRRRRSHRSGRLDVDRARRGPPMPRPRWPAGRPEGRRTSPGRRGRASGRRRRPSGSATTCPARRSGRRPAPPSGRPPMPGCGRPGSRHPAWRATGRSPRPACPGRRRCPGGFAWWGMPIGPGLPASRPVPSPSAGPGERPDPPPAPLDRVGCGRRSPSTRARHRRRRSP